MYVNCFVWRLLIQGEHVYFPFEDQLIFIVICWKKIPIILIYQCSVTHTCFFNQFNDKNQNINNTNNPESNPTFPYFWKPSQNPDPPILQYNTLLLIPYLHPSQSICLISSGMSAQTHFAIQISHYVLFFLFLLLPTFRRIKITPHLNMNTNKAMFPKWKRKLASPPLFLARVFQGILCNVRSFRSAAVSVCCHGRCSVHVSMRMDRKLENTSSEWQTLGGLSFLFV